MAPTPLQQRTTHNTLLLQKLLNLRDGASPFTLILDSLEQSGASIMREFAGRAKISKTEIIFLSFATLRQKVQFENIFIPARGKSLSSLRNEVLSHIPSLSSSDTPLQKFLIIIDTIHPLITSHRNHYPTFLSSLLISPSISLLATLHTEIPISMPSPINPYSPDPTTTLTYLATAILTVRNLDHALARKRARDRSAQEPSFGISEGREGVLVGLHSHSKEASNAVVLEMELRRKSGRGIMETFILSPTSNLSIITLLDSHPSYNSIPIQHNNEAEEAREEEGVQTTFSLGLTEKQKRDREAVVLPYFDAQKEGGALGAGEGGRILYEMGVEDREDFDDEEDEI